MRSVTVAQDDKKSIPHHSEFVITVAHELSTIAILAKDETDFINRTEKAIVAYTYDNKPVTVKDLRMTKAIRQMMHEALMPNLVQSLEGNPVIVSGTPFANISLGTSSVIATKIAQKLANIILVESGFGSDLGCEKNMNLVCPVSDIEPSAIVAVCSCRSLKLHGGQDKTQLDKENVEAVEKGLDNLKVHIKHLLKYNVPIIIAINKFVFDTEAELKAITDYLDSINIRYSISESALKGGVGALDLAVNLLDAIQNDPNDYHKLYEYNDTIENKIFQICNKVYGATSVEFSDLAREQMHQLDNSEYRNLPICISKTPASISDDPKLLGAPTDIRIHIRELMLFAGAGFITALSGSLLLLPGLGKRPRLSDDYGK